MSIFGNKKQVEYNPNQPVASFAPVKPTLDEQSDYMKATAIEYMVSLDKKELESFVEGATLIWQGYNNNVDKVRTRHQKAVQRNLAKANGVEMPAEGTPEDDALFSFIDEDDEPATQTPAAPAKRPLGGNAMDVKKVDVR